MFYLLKTWNLALIVIVSSFLIFACLFSDRHIFFSLISRKAGLILAQLGDLSSWCNGLLQEPKISLRRGSLKYLGCRYSEIKPYGLDWSELSRDLRKTCEEQTLSVPYNDYGDSKDI